MSKPIPSADQSGTVSVDVLHQAFVRIKDRMNINDAKTPVALLSIFGQALEEAELSMARIVLAQQ